MRLAAFAAVTLTLSLTAGSTLAAERGTASVYADRFDGSRTASGEVFRQTKATAAHRKLPFGSVLKVTNLKNGRSVLVTVNDRGPHGNHKRVIDLSKAAAKQLALSGTAPVQVELISR